MATCPQCTTRFTPLIKSAYCPQCGVKVDEITDETVLTVQCPACSAYTPETPFCQLCGVNLTEKLKEEAWRKKGLALRIKLNNEGGWPKSYGWLCGLVLVITMLGSVGISGAAFILTNWALGIVITTINIIAWSWAAGSFLFGPAKRWANRRNIAEASLMFPGTTVKEPVTAFTNDVELGRLLEESEQAGEQSRLVRASEAPPGMLLAPAPPELSGPPEQQLLHIP